MIKSLQTGRGLAAFAVTLFHTSGMFADPRFGFAPHRIKTMNTCRRSYYDITAAECHLAPFNPAIRPWRYCTRRRRGSSRDGSPATA
ncbi:MAG: hypothetical protein QHC40_12755 [Sphingobium sp.]|nr:hypothetical protein [Sphingobium sp.]